MNMNRKHLLHIARLNAQYSTSYRLICVNEVGSLFGILNYVCDIVVKRFTIDISSPDDRLFMYVCVEVHGE